MNAPTEKEYEDCIAVCWHARRFLEQVVDRPDATIPVDLHDQIVQFLGPWRTSVVDE